MKLVSGYSITDFAPFLLNFSTIEAVLRRSSGCATVRVPNYPTVCAVYPGAGASIFDDFREIGD